MAEFTHAERRVEIDNHGTIHADADVLARLGNQRFTLRMSGETVTLQLQPRPRRLHEIEDVQERRAALEAFMHRVARPGPSTLPADWATLRDSIYD